MISETKLNKNHKRITFQHHNFVRTDRRAPKRGGGTAILIHKRLHYELISFPNSHKNNTIEYTAIKIKTNKAVLLVLSIYAAQKTTDTFIEDLDKLFDDLNLNSNNIFFIIAGDLNARHTAWGDTRMNTRGAAFYNWTRNSNYALKVAHYSSMFPTFPKASSYLDHCICDSRLSLVGLINNKLDTIPYDSDHNGIIFSIDTHSIFQGIIRPPPPPIRFNYRCTKWDDFTDHLLSARNSSDQIPADRNLSIEEIDNHIVRLEKMISDSIEATVPKINTNKYNPYVKYVNNRVKKLHSIKSQLLTSMFKVVKAGAGKVLIQEYKSAIKHTNKLLQSEFNKSVTAYWAARVKSINYRDSNSFFPTINSTLRSKSSLSIEALKVDINSTLIADLDLAGAQAPVVNNMLHISNPTNILDVIGKHFENINSPRFTDENQHVRDRVTQALVDIKYKRRLNRSQGITITNFSIDNLAHTPTAENDSPNIFHKHEEVGAIIKYSKNKLSSGLDGIPMIVIRKLPTELVMDYTTLFNNALNHSYYPRRWKQARVIPILKKGKDPTDPTSYRPISLTSNISKLFEKLIKEHLIRHIEEHKIIPDNQFGFRAAHSTMHAITKFSSDINKAVLNNKLVGAVLIDLEKAFDSMMIDLSVILGGEPDGEQTSNKPTDPELGIAEEDIEPNVEHFSVHMYIFLSLRIGLSSCRIAAAAILIQRGALVGENLSLLLVKSAVQNNPILIKMRIEYGMQYKP
ncbi:uncharacterized protein [Chelonus insularis]|uniref:uncharacterized protein n=1 Tax=Chelonus insularis TaxID=460826 RepID=UPI001589451A|nr:uncharacterized protein LOC118069856 [Chelonus insularis]